MLSRALEWSAETGSVSTFPVRPLWQLHVAERRLAESLVHTPRGSESESQASQVLGRAQILSCFTTCTTPALSQNGQRRTRCSRQAPPRIARACHYRRAENWPALPGQACRRSVQIHLALVQSFELIFTRALVAAAEDNINIALKDITVTQRDGRVSQLDQVYIRGSMVRFFIVPDMLQNAPM